MAFAGLHFHYTLFSPVCPVPKNRSYEDAAASFILPVCHCFFRCDTPKECR